MCTIFQMQLRKRRRVEQEDDVHSKKSEREDEDLVATRTLEAIFNLDAPDSDEESESEFEFEPEEDENEAKDPPFMKKKDKTTKNSIKTKTRRREEPLTSQQTQTIVKLRYDMINENANKSKKKVDWKKIKEKLGLSQSVKTLQNAVFRWESKEKERGDKISTINERLKKMRTTINNMKNQCSDETTELMALCDQYQDKQKELENQVELLLQKCAQAEKERLLGFIREKEAENSDLNGVFQGEIVTWYLVSLGSVSESILNREKVVIGAIIEHLMQANILLVIENNENVNERILTEGISQKHQQTPNNQLK